MSGFNENLVKFRKAAGYSQKDFAQLLNIPVTTLSNYENAGREPKYDMLIQIANLLDVTVDDLLADTPEGKYNIFLREKIFDSVKVKFVGDNIVISVSPEFKKESILAMQIAAGFLNVTASIVADKENFNNSSHKFFLRFLDDSDNKN